MTSRTRQPLACVIGDMDLIRPLGLAGIPCAAVAASGMPALYSRFNRATLEWGDAWQRGDELVDTLIGFGAAQSLRPVLFYQHDSDLLLVSRHRDRLGNVFRFLMPDATLIEELVDKSRFQALAARLALPVPPARQLDPRAEPLPHHVGIRFPMILKPLTRRQAWIALGGGGKAIRVDSPTELSAWWGRLAAARTAVLAQELVPGDETAIESYHVYVDADGNIAGEFTGKKLRTWPRRFGDSTALTMTAADDVRQLGQDITRRLSLRGVAKLDFKRGDDRRLHLLEINPRFTLWHHLGAAAGVNIPAQVYGDLVGRPRRPTATARAGVTWCRVWPDVLAAREDGLALGRWMAWVLRCQARSTLSWDDPLPAARAAVYKALDRARRRHAVHAGHHHGRVRAPS